MSWDDWDDDEPRPRRNRWDDDGYSLRRPYDQSGAVTGAGVVTIIMGVLCLLCGVCSGFGGIVMAGAGQMVRQQGGILPPAPFEVTGGILLGWAVLHLILGVLQLIGGILVLQRNSFGRRLTIVLGVINGLLGAGQLVLCVLVGMNEVGGIFFDGDPDSALGKALIWGFIALLYLGHALFVCIVLFNSHNKEEFA